MRKRRGEDTSRMCGSRCMGFSLFIYQLFCLPNHNIHPAFGEIIRDWSRHRLNRPALVCFILKHPHVSSQETAGNASQAPLVLIGRDLVVHFLDRVPVGIIQSPTADSRVLMHIQNMVRGEWDCDFWVRVARALCGTVAGDLETSSGECQVRSGRMR